MNINKHIIRGYDIRGEVGKDLNPIIAEHFGKAYGTYIGKKGAKKVVVGHDSRFTSETYKDSLIKGILSTGLDVIDIGLTLVGTVYWAQYHFDTKAAAMVTASHNPVEYNGFKFANDFSEAMIGTELNELVELINNEEYIQADCPGESTPQNIKEVYFNDITKQFNIKKGIKVVIDASNTTAGAIVPSLLTKVGCQVIEKNCELDGTFPLGAADPTEKKVADRLAKEVLRERADIGFSYDADGDRIGIVDENGTIIWNDVLVALFAIDVLAHHPNSTIMYNTLCSKVVEDTVRANGGKPFMWRTGHGFLKKKNQEIKAPFIGELSGHFFFSADFYNHDDGCYATLRLLDYLSRSGKTLGEAISVLPRYISSPEIKIGCSEDKKVSFVAKIAAILRKDFPKAEIIDDERAGDGVRLDMDDSMLIFRYSQNGPYLTIKFEAKERKKYNELKTYINELLHKHEEVDWAFGVNIESLR